MTNTEVGLPAGEDGIETTRRMYEAVSGLPTAMETRMQVVLFTVIDGRGPVAAELPWQEGPDGTVAGWRQVILTDVRDKRVYFLNSVPSGAPAGTQLGGPGQGPVRRAEADGKESMDGRAFESLWSFGGRAVIERPNPEEEAAS